MSFDWVATYSSTLMTLITLEAMAVMSPGPDFAVVTKNSILYSRHIGVMTALGVITGVFFHLSYLVMGFGLVVASLTKALFAIKVAGACYLGYLGWKGITAGPAALNQKDENKAKKKSQRSLSTTFPSSKSAFLNGLLTNVLNPKAILFLISLFTIVIEKDTPTQVLLVYGLVIVLITALWFLFVALTFSGKLRRHFLQYSQWIDRATGGFLLFVAVKIGVSCF